MPQPTADLADLTLERPAPRRRRSPSQDPRGARRVLRRDTVVVDDATYDEWMHRLEAIERLHPEVQSQDSPTLTVGAASGTLFAPVEHAERMLSLDNVFSDDEFLAWAAKVERDAGQARALPVRAEDRRARALAALRARPAHERRHARRRPRRRGRHRERAADRRDPAARSRARGIPTLVEVRGEVFFNVADFESLNAYQESHGRSAVREPAQRGERVAPPEDRGQERPAARGDAPAPLAPAH